MYQLDTLARIRSFRRASAGAPGTGSPQHLLDVSPAVWKLGFTSCLTDISSEMVASILPVYFVLHLHFSTVEFGFLDGLSQGAAVALLSVVAGAFADRWRRQKEVATAGYALSTLSRFALLGAGRMWILIAGILAVDRIGKGIRTAPRDAMISLFSSREKMATAFAVHRGLDTCGAVFGPLTAFLLLRLFSGAFDVVLMASSCFAIVGLGVIVLLVDNPASATGQVSPALTLPSCLALLRHQKFRVLVVAAGVLGIATISDGFIYLVLQRNSHSSPTSIPLYAFVTAVSYLLLSVPAGLLADQWGRAKVFVIGYGLLASVYALILFPEADSRGSLGVVALLGAYYAATDGVFAAMTSATLDASLRTTGLALLNTASSLSRLLSSVLFGWMWASGTVRTAVWGFLLALMPALIVSARIIAERKRK